MKTKGLVLDGEVSVGVEPDEFYDMSRFKNDGVSTDITWVRLPSGLWVMSFNGTSSFINCGNNRSFDWIGAITFEAWIRAPDAATYRKIYTKASAFNNDLSPYQFGLSIDGRMFTTTGSGIAYHNQFGNTEVDDDVWHHVAAAMSGLNVNFFLDGAGDGSGVHVVTPANNTANFLIGRLFNAYHFNGYMALLKVHNYALTAGQILQRYEATRRLFGV